MLKMFFDAESWYLLTCSTRISKRLQWFYVDEFKMLLSNVTPTNGMHEELCI